MNFLKIFLIINLSLVLASCSNSIIVKIDKDKRIITRELKNGKIKTINQKFNSLYHQQFEAECASKKTSFDKCDDEEIILKHGFIAQEVKQIIDDNNLDSNCFGLWSKQDDGTQGLAEGELTPILVKAVQELSAKVKALEEA